MSKFTRPGGAQPAISKPSAKPASKYKKANQTQLGVEANYQRAGRYLLMIERIEEGVTPRGKEDFVSVHSVVLAADGSERTPLEQRFGGALHRVGESTSWFQKLKGDYFDQNMLKFAIAASNMTQEEIAAAEEESGTTIIEEMVGSEQPFAGVVLEAHVTIRIGKKARDAGKPEDQLTAEDVFTMTNWVRRVPYDELKELVEAETLAQFLPDLDAKIVEETKS
jgi:hypothetical protein